MALFGLFGNKDSVKKTKGYYELSVAQIISLNSQAVLVEFNVPDELRSSFAFIPGQYLNIIVSIENKEYRRSYSICSHNEEPLRIAVKRVENGVVSNWFNDVGTIDTPLSVSLPQGNFVLPEETKSFTAIAAGSGITPIMSILSSKKEGQEVNLIYGNKTAQEGLFLDEIEKMSMRSSRYFFSREKRDDAHQGRIDKSSLTELIKEDIALLKNDCFLICGPEDMIHTCIDALKFFGVAEEKILYELFTTPSTPKETEGKTKFSGTSKVSVLLDDEEVSFELDSGGSTILEAVEENGFDPPFSCRGGVCCSCKAKVINGSASMELNYSLTDEEVKQGYILTCQAHPSSESIEISYDE